jgi:hypothetical protein
MAAAALNLMLVMLGQDISNSSKYNHRACDEKLVNHNNSSKKPVVRSVARASIEVNVERH